MIKLWHWIMGHTELYFLGNREDKVFYVCADCGHVTSFPARFIVT